MNRNAGYFALLMVLLTGVHFAPVSAGKREAAEKEQPRGESSRAEPSSAGMRVDTVCEAFATPEPANRELSAKGEESGTKDSGQIATLIDRFLYGSAESRHLGSGMLPEGMKLMIVTVPDPAHTYLSLQFDRTLEALQQAAQDERYTYDSSWLPWKTGRGEASGGSDRDAAARQQAKQETCPGVILFRRNMSSKLLDNCRIDMDSAGHAGDALYACGMLVFIVAEKPTSGLNRVEWDNAVGWLVAHASKRRPDRALRILGPAFSGSIPSLVRALQAANADADTFASTLLYSGRIRGCASWHWLASQVNAAQFVPKTGSGPEPLPVRIADFEENDAIQSDRFFRYLADRDHRLSEVAILSEDETAYGGLPDAHSNIRDCDPGYAYSDRPVHLYYPRDISAIRSAYQEQSIFSTSSKTDSSKQPQTVLRDDYDSNSPQNTDTVQPFSGTNLALTQEAQLYGIVNTLKTHGIRYVVLRSTNSLDYLFLTRFLHRAYPTAYIVTTGSDLLFGREVDSTEFRGVVALSSFPLLPRGQDWTKEINGVPQHAHRVFGSYTMEGAYLAARFLITDPGATKGEIQSGLPFQHPAKADIPDFAQPFWEKPIGTGTESSPATWLSVIGRDGYWPLATLTLPLQAPRFSNLAVVTKPVEPPNPDKNHQPRPERMSLSGSWRFCCVLALLALGLHFFACRYGWTRQSLGMFVQFTPLGGQRGPALIAAGCTAVSCLLVVLFLTAFRMYAWLGGMDRAWVWMTGAGVAASLIFGVMEARWWTQPPSWVDDRRAWKCNVARTKCLHYSPAWLALMFAAILIFAGAIWLTFDFGKSDGSGITTAYRAVHLASGVSPVVSLLFITAGFYWWFWQSLSGLALLGNGRPVLPRATMVPAGFTQISDAIANDIDRAATPFPWFGKVTLLLYLLPLFLVFLLAFVLQRAWMQSFDLVLHSLENQAFNRTLHGLVSICLYLILLDCLQFYGTWLSLKRLLEALNRLPLRRTFAALQGLSMRSLWRFSGTSSRARYKVFSHQLESLLHLRNELGSTAPADAEEFGLYQGVRAAWAQGWRFVQDRSSRRDFAMVNDPEAHAIRIRFCSCAELVLRNLLVKAWQNERVSLDLRAAPVEGKAEETMALSEDKAVCLGEEFVCMVYVGYLQNLLGRMRTMVLSMAGMFAAIALSMGFYPYTPRPTISLSLLILLLVIGAVVGTVYAGLDRDSTLSHITNTEPGQLGAHFWIRILSFVGVPAMGLIVAQFPEITDFVFSWVEPTITAMK